MIKPYFSIIIPTLNEERFLPHLLNSLAKQSFKDFETIIVDASSIDGTTSQAASYLDQLPHLKLYIVKKRSVSYQRNFGAKKAKGRYFIFFDADVVIPGDFLSLLFANVKKDRPPLATTWLLPDSTTTTDEMIILFTNLGLEIAKKIDKPLAPGFNTIVKREVFGKISGFDERIKLGEDHELVQRALEFGYTLTIYRQIKLVASLRRLRREGLLRLVSKYVYATFYVFLKGPIVEDIISYPMGGHLYHEWQVRESDNNWQWQIKKYIGLDRYLGIKSFNLKPKVRQSTRKLVKSFLKPFSS